MSPFRRLSFSIVLAAALGALLLAVQPVSAQVPADSVLRGFELSGDFVLSVDGVEQPKAKIYQSQRAAAILVRSSAFESPLLISPRSGSVQTVPIMSLALRGATADILADAELQAVGRFRLDGEDVVFGAEGKQVRLSPRPDVTGEKSGSALRSDNPAYAQSARSYTPDDAVLTGLRGSSKDVRVRTFFGSWCSFCKRYLPRLLRVEQELAGSGIDFDYYGLPHDFSDDVEAKRNGVSGVPTGIVYVDGKEVGRIERDDWTKPEEALLKLVRGS